jgi:hypothetical protein
VWLPAPAQVFKFFEDVLLPHAKKNKNSVKTLPDDKLTEGATVFNQPIRVLDDVIRHPPAGVYLYQVVPQLKLHFNTFVDLWPLAWQPQQASKLSVKSSVYSGYNVKERRWGVDSGGDQVRRRVFTVEKSDKTSILPFALVIIIGNPNALPAPTNARSTSAQKLEAAEVTKYKTPMEAARDLGPNAPGINVLKHARSSNRPKHNPDEFGAIQARHETLARLSMVISLI